MPAYLALIFMLLCAAGTAAAAELTAREYFAVLPATIFENTPEGLPDEEKRQLLETGRTEFWELRNEKFDALDMVSVPFGESGVALRVFRGAGGKGGTLVTLGTTGTPMCTIELWRADANGRIVPVEAPEEPPIRDFFTSDPGVPADVSPSILFCVEEGGLEARPVFWNASGMAHVPVHFRVHYVWTGGQFRKEVSPAP